jgi:hypothetical protein
MTLRKMTAGDVRLTDELFAARTPCGVRPRDRDTGAAADSANGLDPAFALRRHNGAQSGYGLMNQRCQQFSGGPQSSRTPGTTFVCVVFLLDPGLVRATSGSYNAATGDHAPTSGAIFRRVRLI